MKYIIFCLLIAFSLSDYSPAKAVTYARKYCKNYNSDYIKYPGADCANFVSQCLKAGGQSLSGCNGLDKKGAIPYVPNLRSCLTKKGWKSQQGVPKKFKAGYPLFKTSGSHAMLATKVEGNNVYFAAHTTNYYDHKLTYSVDYYYP